MQHTVTIGVPYKDDYVDVTVSFKYYYDPGRQYMANGDPGYPPEETVDIVKVHGKVPDYITNEMIEDAIWDNLDLIS